MDGLVFAKISWSPVQGHAGAIRRAAAAGRPALLDK